MIDVIVDTLLDCLKLLPFLFLTYLFMEYLEHKTEAHAKKAVEKAGAFGPLLGSAFGIVPQCGFSASAAGLYASGLISVGTLLAIFLSTSDEMLPIFLSEGISIVLILKILSIKAGTALICGYAADGVNRFLLKKKPKQEREFHDICEKEHCHCERGIFRSALHHTLRISLFLLIITFALNTFIHFIGEDTLAQLISGKAVPSVLLASLVGLIPNCAASVILTKLYLDGVLGAGALIGGLLTGAGIGLLVLFRQNNSLKASLAITAALYACGVLFGLLFTFTPVSQWLSI